MEKSDVVGTIVRGVLVLAALLMVFLAPLSLPDSYATGVVAGGVAGGLVTSGVAWFFSD